MPPGALLHSPVGRPVAQDVLPLRVAVTAAVAVIAVGLGGLEEVQGAGSLGCSGGLGCVGALGATITCSCKEKNISSRRLSETKEEGDIHFSFTFLSTGFPSLDNVITTVAGVGLSGPARLQPVFIIQLQSGNIINT